MIFNYAQTAATALRLLLRFGAACTIRRVTTGAYNASTGTQATTTADLATVAAVFDYPRNYIDGTLVKQGDKQAFLDPGVAPAAGDTFIWKGVNHTVVSVKAVAPSGITVLWEAQVRG